MVMVVIFATHHSKWKWISKNFFKIGKQTTFSLNMQDPIYNIISTIIHGIVLSLSPRMGRRISEGQSVKEQYSAQDEPPVEPIETANDEG